MSKFRDNLRLLFSSDILLDLGNKKRKLVDLDKSGMSDSYNSSYARIRKSRTYLPHLNNNFNRINLFRKYEKMDKDAIISSALDIYADESTVKNENSDILKIKSTNKNVKTQLESLYGNILNLEFNLWTWIRTMVKYGDCYIYQNVEKNKGITNVHFISNYDIDRLEDEEVRFNLLNGIKINNESSLYNYQITHFRLLSDNNYLPYGKSILEGARKSWEALILMEDAMLLHRIMRSPEKRLYKIDVSNINPKDVDAYMQDIIDNVKKTPFMDESTGEYNLKYNLESSLEDLFLPVRGDKSGNDVSTLSGMDFNGIDDIEYLRNKMMASLKIPKPFLGYDESVEGKCVSPETEIPLINGEIKKVKHLIEDYENGVINNVYSLDETTNEIVAGEIEWAGYTRMNTQVVRVWLDNGEYLDTTPDHYFLTKDNIWIQAQNLSIDLELMPHKKENTIYKVSKVEWLSENIDTCDITVKDYHNFGTNAGVIIHNSTLASMDLRFARTIEYIQRIITSELRKMGVIHLYALGFSPKEALNFELELTSPSIIYEQEKISLLNEKVRLAQDMVDTKIFSFKEIYSKIFDLNADQLEQVKQDVVNDSLFKFRLEQIEREGNDPQKTKKVFGTPHSLAMMNYKEDSEMPDDGWENSGRPPEGTKYNTQKHPHGRNSLGKDTYKQVSTKNDKSSKIKHDFKNNSPVALDHYNAYRDEMTTILKELYSDNKAEKKKDFDFADIDLNEDN